MVMDEWHLWQRQGLIQTRRSYTCCYRYVEHWEHYLLTRLTRNSSIDIQWHKKSSRARMFEKLQGKSVHSWIVACKWTYRRYPMTGSSYIIHSVTWITITHHGITSSQECLPDYFGRSYSIAAVISYAHS